MATSADGMGRGVGLAEALLGEPFVPYSSMGRGSRYEYGTLNGSIVCIPKHNHRPPVVGSATLVSPWWALNVRVYPGYPVCIRPIGIRPCYVKPLEVHIYPW